MVEKSGSFAQKYTFKKDDYIDGKSGDPGAMFRVVRGTRSSDGSAVAVKYSISNQGNHLLQEEKDILTSLGPVNELSRHSILAPFDWGTLDNRYSACALELQDGSLDRLQGTLHIRDFSCWAIQLGAALSFLHEKKICHADLKPGNVLFKVLAKEAKIFLIDFSYAGGEQEAEGENCPNMGTVGWQAPEQVIPQNGFWQIGPWIDMYQLGLLLFYLLTESQIKTERNEQEEVHGYGEKEQGQLQYALQQMAETQIKKGEELKKEEWVKKWHALISRLLEVDRDERMSIEEFCDEAGDSWKSLEGSLAVPWTPPAGTELAKKEEEMVRQGGEQPPLSPAEEEQPTPRPTPQATSPKKRWPLVVLVLLLLFAVSGTLYGYIHSRPQLPQEYTLNITTDPEECSLVLLAPEKRNFIDGMSLQEGRYLVEAADPAGEYKTLQQWIPLTKNSTVSLKLKPAVLEPAIPEPVTFSWTLNKTPANAAVTFSGGLKEGTPARQGTYTAHLSATGYENMDATVTVPGTTSVVMRRIEEVPSIPAIPVIRHPLPVPPEPPQVSTQTLNHFVKIAGEMDLTVSRTQIRTLLEHPVCARLSGSGERVSLSFIEGSFIGRKGGSLLHIISPDRELPVKSAFIEACALEQGSLSCKSIFTDLLPCN